MPSPNEILSELKKVKFPGFTRDIVSFGLVKDIEVGHSGVTVTLGAVSANPDVVKAITEEIKKAVAAMPGVPGVEVEVETAQPARAPAPRARAADARYPASSTCSPSPAAKAGSENRPSRSTWRWR